MKLWLRLGDAGEYVEWWDDFTSLANYLKEELNVHSIRWVERGFTAPGFERANYISLYFGDDEGNFLREVSFDNRMVISGILN